MRHLLAVDMGLRTGLALFREDGRLLWYRSQHFGNRASLKRGAYLVLRDIPELAWLVIEGGGPLAEVWKKEAARRSVPVMQLSAEDWRESLLFAREQRSGSAAKHHAGELARSVIARCGGKAPTSLRHDAAEAILAGYWGLLRCGWLEEKDESPRK